jgi:hypothetical protein
MRVSAKRIVGWILPLALGLAAAVALPVPAQQRTEALVVGGAAPDLFLLYTGDVIGYLEPCG